MRFVRVIAVAILATFATGLAACGGGDDTATTPTTTVSKPSAPPIRIGTKDFAEQYILGELYRQALEAKGFDVELKPKVGSSEIIHQALDNGVLDMYPEYVGVLLSEVANVTRRPRRPEAAYALAKRIEERGDFTLLAQTPFSDANALAVTPAFARRNHVRSITDLRRLRRKVKIGAPKEFRTRFEGLIGLRRVYKMRNAQFRRLALNRRYRSLDAGRVDVALVLTTERQLAGDKYVELADPRMLFASGHVAPVISRKALKAHGPRLRAAIDAVSAKLTTPAMRRMNGSVDINKRTPREVATQFLRAQGLL